MIQNDGTIFFYLLNLLLLLLLLLLFFQFDLSNRMVVHLKCPFFLYWY